MFLFIGTLVHILVGLGFRLAFRWNAFVVGTIFAAKEFGELKYRLPGSITTWQKNLAMLQELLTNPLIVPQWLLPALAVWVLGRVLARRSQSRRHQADTTSH